MQVKIFNASEEEAINAFLTEHNLNERHLNLGTDRVFIVYDTEDSDKEVQIKHLKEELRKTIFARLSTEIDLRNFRSIESKKRGSKNRQQTDTENVIQAERNVERQTEAIGHLRETIAAIESGELVI